MLNRSGNNMREILHRRESDLTVLASINHEHPALFKVKRRLESGQVSGRCIRRGEVVSEQTWLEEAVLQHFRVFIDFLEVPACCGFVEIWIQGLGAGSCQLVGTVGQCYLQVTILGRKLLHAPFTGGETFHASLYGCINEILLNGDSLVLVAMGRDER
jgi:hypothetical protein